MIQAHRERERAPRYEGSNWGGLVTSSIFPRLHEKRCLSLGGIQWEFVSYILQMTSDWESVCFVCLERFNRLYSRIEIKVNEVVMAEHIQT